MMFLAKLKLGKILQNCIYKANVISVVPCNWTLIKGPSIRIKGTFGNMTLPSSIAKSLMPSKEIYRK